VKNMFMTVLQSMDLRGKDINWGHLKDLFQGCYEWKNNWNRSCLSRRYAPWKKNLSLSLFWWENVLKTVPSSSLSGKGYHWRHSKDYFKDGMSEKIIEIGAVWAAICSL
jgi:hypothetical protein